MWPSFLYQTGPCNRNKQYKHIACTATMKRCLGAIQVLLNAVVSNFPGKSFMKVYGSWYLGGCQFPRKKALCNTWWPHNKTLSNYVFKLMILCMQIIMRPRVKWNIMSILITLFVTLVTTILTRTRFKTENLHWTLKNCVKIYNISLFRYIINYQSKNWRYIHK